MKRNPALAIMIKRIMSDKTLRRRVFELDNGECVYCGLPRGRRRLVPNRTIDHLAPISLMTDVDMSAICHPSNLVTACKPCNSEMADRDLFEKSPRFGRFRIKKGGGS